MRLGRAAPGRSHRRGRHRSRGRAEALKVVAAAGVELDNTEYDLGAARYLRTGEVLPERCSRSCGATTPSSSGPSGPPVGDARRAAGLLERGLLLRLRFELDLYVNLRPFLGVPGSVAEGADFVVVRENTEGTYAGEGGFLRKGTPHEVATQGRSTPAWASSVRPVRLRPGPAAARPTT